jgi:hypothetical protein
MRSHTDKTGSAVGTAHTLPARVAVGIAVLLVAVGLSACGMVVDIAKSFLEELPTAENTHLTIQEVNIDIIAAMARGETEITFNIADASESELKHLADNMPTFWGTPDEYVINNEFDGITNILADREANVKNVTATLALSNNYYVYQNIVNGAPIPEGMHSANMIAEALPGIAAEIFASAGESDYDKTLAVHNWLVANLDYDEFVDDLGEENGSFGALVNRRTMCQGYAEALALILKCYTSVEVEEVVGDARDISAISGGDPAEVPPDGDDEGGATDTSVDGSTDREWVGHAWDVVNMDGNWYQVDATFDDPTGNPAGMLQHYYFGQNDTVMLADHRWDSAFYPVCESEDFYYFRRGGLFADDFEAFKTIVSGLVAENPAVLQVAGIDVTLDSDSIQFIFSANDSIVEIAWSEQVYENIHLQTIEPSYE